MIQRSLTMTTTSVLIIASLFLQGCSALTPQTSTANEDASKAAIKEQTKAPERPFPAETLYALLVAEMAGSRERYDIALGNYIQQAHKTRDPGLAARATRIARYLNARQAALNTSLLWIDISPDDMEARYTAATELAQSGQLDKAMVQSNYLQEHGGKAIYQVIAAQASAGSNEQRDTLIQQYQALQKQYPKDTELLVGLGLMYQQQNQLDDALDMAEQALDINDELMPAVILETRILTLLDRQDEALKRTSVLLNRHPDNDRLRLQYARLLASTDLGKAQEQFDELLKNSPNDPELIYALALINNERGQLDTAKDYFLELTAFEHHRSSAHYYLGRIAEKEQQWDMALQYFLQVEPGSDFMPATFQSTDILVRGGQASAAHKRLDVLREQFPLQAERFYLLEGEVLNNHLKLTDAQRILSEGLNQFPNSPPLLYSRAMVNEQLDRFDDMEDDLRLILKTDPDNATALNALGYTLADRTTRYDEAYVLISQALQLKPDDPAILDSMGWVQYRLGNYPEAILRLQEAMKAYPDHEIAAHLGEVLWVSGQKDEAEEIWEEGLKLKPDSRIITDVMNRLKAVESTTSNP